MRSRRSLLELAGRPVHRVLDRQREAARLLTVGLSNDEVAAATGYHPQYIPLLKKHPGVVEVMDHLRAGRDASAMDFQSRVKEGATAGLDILLNVLTPGTHEHEKADLGMQVKVATDLLDREGSAPRTTKKSVEGRHLHAVLTTEEIEDIKARARSRKLVSQPVTPPAVEAAVK